MRVLTILGSPKKHGKTAKVLDSFEQNLLSMGHEIKRLHVIDYKINGCLGCMACMRSADQPGCVQKDDVPEIFTQMIDADAIVYASPNYGWDFSGQLKLLLDRHLCMVKGFHTPSHMSFLEGKPILFLITAMGPDEAPNTDLLKKTTDRFGYYVKAGMTKTYVVPKSMQPDFDERAKQIAIKMAQDIAQQRGFSFL